jgi:four helix bundle protein
MSFLEWSKAMPKDITDDALWRMKVYQLALFAADIGWRDVTKLFADKRTLDLSSQLYAALGSISANISEGYSRGSGKDRARFYEYALGSARESRNWYFIGRHILGEVITQHRISLLTEIVRLLLTIVPEERAVSLREEAVPYQVSAPPSAPITGIDSLLQNVPLP